jgi:hypothetical protein
MSRCSPSIQAQAPSFPGSIPMKRSIGMTILVIFPVRFILPVLAFLRAGLAPQNAGAACWPLAARGESQGNGWAWFVVLVHGYTG